MIIEGIYIEGFGHFHNYTVGALKPGLNLLIGDNEVGKSTLLNFIRYTLFGYPSRTTERCEPLNGGKHGGRIKGLSLSGAGLIFERYAGSKGGDIRLNAGGRDSDDVDEWNTYLGNTNFTLYNNVYGISLYELVGFGNIDDAGISDKILSIGIGLGDVSISGVMKALSEKTDAIYKDRGKTQEISELLRSIEAKKIKLQEIQQGLPRYDQVLQKLSEIDTEVRQLQDRLKQKGREKVRLENYRNCYDTYVELQQIEKELTGWSGQFECVAGSDKEFEKLTGQRILLQEKMASLVTNANNDGKEDLESRIRVITYSEPLLREEAEIEALKQEITNFETIRKDYENELTEIDALEQQVSQKIKKISDSWNAETIRRFSNGIEKKSKVTSFKNEFEGLRQQIVNLNAKKLARDENASWLGKIRLPYVLALVFAAFAAPLFFYAPLFAYTCVALAILVLLLQNYLFPRKPDVLSGALQSSEQALKDLQQRYASFLRQDLNLDQNLTCDDVLLIIDQIDGLVSDLARLKRMSDVNTKERQAYIENFQTRIQALRAKNLLAAAPESPQPFIHALSQQLAKDRQSRSDKLNLEKTLALRNREIAQAAKELEQTGEKIQKIVTDSKCASEAEFMRKTAAESNAAALLAQQKTLVHTMERIAGLGERENVVAYFQGHSKQDTEEAIRTLITEIDKDNEDLTKMNQLYGEYTKEKEGLVRSAALAEVATELETDKLKLKEAYKRWLSGKLALRVFDDVKKRFEKEHQPEVIKYAGDLFSKITGGKYKRINVSIEDRTVSVIEANERSKTIDQLSRGAKEQLLLCLRLGLIQEYEKNREPLPLVLDDILVNADPGRTDRLAAILESFAESRQLILLTCNPDLKSRFSGQIHVQYLS